MMISTKPMSSPSRTEKFPPPLMRFLRSNVGSRSRGRSRSSPMFVRKKNAVIETQEPTSPKVTCIGQVRVRRSSKQSGGRSGRPRAPARGRCSCSWARKTLFCHRFVKKLEPKSFRPVWKKWVWFFRFGCCRRGEIGDDSSKMETNRKGKYRANEIDEEEEDDDDDEEEAQVKVAPSEAFNSSSPPKNALLLTRCRSAPYRSSSLASRFWGSPLTAASETEVGSEENKALQHQQQLENREVSESELNSRDSVGLEIRGKLRFSREIEGLINGKSKESNLVEEVETGEGRGPARPVILTRCKSEPARTGERLNLNLEASFWRHRRLGFAEPCSPHPHVCD